VYVLGVRVDEEVADRDRTHAALRAAFDAHYAPLVRLCALLTADRGWAEDLARECFVRTAPRIGSLAPEAVGLWLRRIAYNQWENVLHRRAVERRAASRPPRDGEPVHLELDDVWDAVRRLPLRRRACIVLRYHEDLSEREISEILGCRVGTVKRQTSRALARLRKEVGDEDR
jgi:RNA polymerase sigma factor (sigma-70 family)